MLKITQYSVPSINSEQKISNVVNEPQNIENPQKIDNELLSKAMLAKSQINFRGKFNNLTKKDLLFISSLKSTFNLNSECESKLKDSLCDYLRQNNYLSLDDVLGSNNRTKKSDITELLRNIAEQSNLAAKLNNVLKFNDERIAILLEKIVERCRAKDDTYSPSFKPHTDPSYRNTITESIKNEKANDLKFIEAIRTTFGLNDEETRKVHDMVNKTLIEADVFTLKELQGDEGDNYAASLAEQIGKAFDLSDYEIYLIIEELSNRTFSGAGYKPSINPLDRNEEARTKHMGIFNHIMKRYEMDYKTLDNLYIAMKNDAYKHNCQGALDIFKLNRNIEDFKETFAILNTPDFQSIKEDLMIDFYMAAKDIDKTWKMMHKPEDTGISLAESYDIIINLDKIMDFSAQEMNALKKYFKDKRPSIETEKDIMETAYRLTEDFNLPAESFNSVVDAIRHSKSLPEEELQLSIIKFIQLLNSKQ